MSITGNGSELTVSRFRFIMSVMNLRISLRSAVIPDQLCVRGMYVSVTCHDGYVYGELLKKW